MIKLVLLCSQTRFYISQAFSVGELRERHAAELVEARKRFYFVTAAIALNTTTEGVHWQVSHDLRENKTA